MTFTRKDVVGGQGRGRGAGGLERVLNVSAGYFAFR